MRLCPSIYDGKRRPRSEGTAARGPGSAIKSAILHQALKFLRSEAARVQISCRAPVVCLLTVSQTRVCAGIRETPGADQLNLPVNLFCGMDIEPAAATFPAARHKLWTVNGAEPRRQ